jgi:hypothetical protein
VVDPADARRLFVGGHQAVGLQVGVFGPGHGGATLALHGREVGQAFFGPILVDPAVPSRSGRPGAARSMDGGRTWEGLTLPPGATLVEAGPGDAHLLSAAGLGAGPARVWVTRDDGKTWARP